MTASGPTGLSFSEVMTGVMTLGQTDPGVADQSQRPADAWFALSATLTIADVRRFISDPEHAGSLTGTVSFPPLGMNLPVETGTFGLFLRSGDPEVKLMSYRATFSSRGEIYRLDGVKHVRRGWPLRGWADTTTLVSRLHLGADEGAPACAAGVLRLTPRAFVHQLLSFRTIAAGTPAEAVGALAGFFGFFSRELLDSYLFRGIAPR